MKEVDCLDISREGCDAWEAAVRRYEDRIGMIFLSYYMYHKICFHTIFVHTPLLFFSIKKKTKVVAVFHTKVTSLCLTAQANVQQQKNKFSQ